MQWRLRASWSRPLQVTPHLTLAPDRQAALVIKRSSLRVHWREEEVAQRRVKLKHLPLQVTEQACPAPGRQTVLEGLLAARVQGVDGPAPPAPPPALLGRGGRARALWLRDPAYAQQPAEAPSVELRLHDDQVVSSSRCAGLSLVAELSRILHAVRYCQCRSCGSVMMQYSGCECLNASGAESYQLPVCNRHSLQS